MKLQRLSLFALSCLFASALHGQASVDLPQLDVEGATWPVPPAASAGFEAVGAGFVTDGIGSEADIVALRGGELALLYRSMRFDAVLSVDSGVSGFAIVPAVGLPAPDGILATTAAGAFLYTLSASDPGAFNARDLLLGEWAGAHGLRFDGQDALIGISADGFSILRALWDGSMATTQLSLPSADPLMDIQFMDWDSDGVDEIVARGLTTVQFFEQTGGGVPFLTIPTSGANDLIAVSRGRGPGAVDFLAWYAVDDVGNAWLYIVNSTFMETPLFLGAIGLDGLTAVGFDWLDGAPDVGDDLFLSLPGIDQVWILRRVQGAGSGAFVLDLVGGAYFDLSRGGAPDANAILTGSFDLDSDGDRDLFFGHSGADVVIEIDNDLTDRFASVPVLTSGQFDTSDRSSWIFNTTFINSAKNTPATHVQFEVWAETSLGAGLMDPGLVSITVPIDQGVVDIAIPATALGAQSVLEVHVRGLALDSLGNVLQAFPTAVGFWSPDSSVRDRILTLPEVAPYHPSVGESFFGGDPILASGLILGGHGHGHTATPPSQ